MKSNIKKGALLMAPKVKLGDISWKLPRSRLARIIIGTVLIIGGIMGFLPVLGFWMIPLGLLVLSVDLPIVRRWRRNITIWWGRRRNKRSNDTRANPASTD